MTEDDALTSWCPMVRHMSQFPQRAAVNRAGDKRDFALCIGSACMMWRWRVASREEQITLARSIAKAPGKSTSESEAEANRRLEGDGYCGLAGRPEFADGGF